MRHSIEFGGDRRDVTVTTHGSATPEGFIQFNEELVDDPRFRPGMAILIDHSDLDVTPLTDVDIRAIAYCIVRLGERLGDSLAAVVAPSSLGHGLARASISFVRPTALRLETFRSADDALDWLDKQLRQGVPDLEAGA
ncbi:MAG: hypothetical protein QOH23_2277 [Gaiellaceae bacterium]|jgi:hypothetical protein|nr:hypothetical protein [Gaiellaceae bacterium]